jgi:predicted ATP-dependent serine protease
VINSLNLKARQFKPLPINGKWKYFLGDLTQEPFVMMISSMPGSGKSTLAIMLAKYFAHQLNWKVLFQPVEEKIGATLKDKFSRTKSYDQNIFIDDAANNYQDYKLVIIDSTSYAGMNYDSLKRIVTRFKPMGVSFIFIFHATKSGKFRGTNDNAHLVDIEITLKNGIAENIKNRYGGSGKLQIF